jgi:hypothetical protein
VARNSGRVGNDELCKKAVQKFSKDIYQIAKMVCKDDKIMGVDLKILSAAAVAFLR